MVSTSYDDIERSNQPPSHEITDLKSRLQCEGADQINHLKHLVDFNLIKDRKEGESCIPCSAQYMQGDKAACGHAPAGLSEALLRRGLHNLGRKDV